jgi:hypothetical protein
MAPVPSNISHNQSVDKVDNFETGSSKISAISSLKYSLTTQAQKSIAIFLIKIKITFFS